MEQTNQSVSWQGFSYEAFWEAQVAFGPRKGTVEQGEKHAVIPVLPIRTAVQQIEQSFQLEELQEEEIDVEDLLHSRTVVEVEDFLEAQGFERCVGLDEVERLIEQQTLGVIQFTPRGPPEFTQTLEEINGEMVDVSAFNTHDFEAQAAPCDPRQWRRRNVLNRCRDLAILRDVVRDEQARRTIQQRMNALLQTLKLAEERHAAQRGVQGCSAAINRRSTAGGPLARPAADAQGAESACQVGSQGAGDAWTVVAVG